MRHILVITSSTEMNNEFQKWIDGNNGRKSEDGAYLVEGKIGHITVIDGTALNNPLTKAENVLLWIKYKTDNSIAPSDMGLMVHGQKDELGEVVKICCARGTNLSGVARDYYTGTKSSRNQYRLIEQFWKKVPHADNLVASLVAWLWKETSEQKGEEACRLRAEILTPLVAWDLIEQAIAAKKNDSIDVPQGFLKQINVPPGLREQIDDAVSKLGNPKHESINKYCCLASINCEGFREEIEKLCKQCGSSETSSWKKFHDDLKDVAKQMEAQIQAIGG